ncbi:hypothetical protein AVEN_18765-1, partial [Araneus ventricosus]
MGLNRTQSLLRKGELSSVASKRRDPSCHVMSAHRELPIVASKLRLQTAFLCGRNTTFVRKESYRIFPIPYVDYAKQ